MAKSKKPRNKKMSAASKAKIKARTQNAKTNITVENSIKKLLHVGCGQAGKDKLPKIFQGDDWQEVSLDIEKSVNPDVIGDIRDMPAVDDSSMNGVFSSHNLEHVYAHEVKNVLSEFFRVLLPGGLVVITLPDIQSIAFAVAEGRLEDPLYHSPSGPISPLDIIYGFGKSVEQGSHSMAHKTAFTSHTLGRKMLDAGFHNVKIMRENGTYNLWAHGYKPGGMLKESSSTASISGRYPKSVIDLPRPGELKHDLDAEPKIWKPLNL